MTSMQPLWWFALPILLLPLWWHLQKRERTRTELLATARFLPAATPRQQRVPRLVDLMLLLARLLLLVALIAWLAVLAMPWKRDTVFIDPSLASDPWAQQQISAAGMTGAAREPLPADAWSWLARNEHAWHPTARLLIVSRTLPMPALPPRLAHTINLATAAPAPAASTPAPASASTPSAAASASALAAASASASAPASVSPPPPPPASASPTPGAQPPSRPQPQDRHIVVASTPERLARWQALFAAFSTAGEGAYRYVLSDTPTRDTELIVWDRIDTPPPSTWQAPLWWRTAAASDPAPAPATSRSSAQFAPSRTTQGLTWSAPQWPLTDPAAARVLYEQWQQQSKPWPTYPMPSLRTLPAQRKTPLQATIAASPDWLAIVLAALFAIERTLAHVRRR